VKGALQLTQANYLRRMETPPQEMGRRERWACFGVGCMLGGGIGMILIGLSLASAWFVVGGVLELAAGCGAIADNYRRSADRERWRRESAAFVKNCFKVSLALFGCIFLSGGVLALVVGKTTGLPVAAAGLVLVIAYGLIFGWDTELGAGESPSA
jgi:hypothetical protein